MLTNSLASRFACAVSLTVWILTAVCQFATAQEPTEYQNLQVLDAHISRDELGRLMLQNLQGLGLPRRQREGCLYCHVGSMDLPVSEWDFAADDKPAKDKARVMMKMVTDINTNHLAALEDRIDPDFEVTCYSCHAGRVDPRPLTAIMLETWREAGAQAAVEKYSALRTLYYAADAYDFRPATLINVAATMSNTGAWEDALLIARLNESANPESDIASRARFSLQLHQELSLRGVSSVLAKFEELRDSERRGVVDFSVLDGLGWSAYRQDQIGTALEIFRRNLALYGDEYIPHESLGDALWFAGAHDAGAEVFDRWVSSHPEHEMARRRLLNMREEMRQNSQ